MSGNSAIGVWSLLPPHLSHSCSSNVDISNSNHRVCLETVYPLFRLGVFVLTLDYFILDCRALQVFTLTVLFLCKACGAFIISQLAPRNEWSACPGPGPAAPRSRRAPCLENIYPKYRVGTIAAEWRSGHQDLAGPRDRVRPRNCLF